ncbi:MAG: type II toxin-antitoxin system HicA family toxin [Anaerolineae bacterium]|nr:type II toxin-antitoxin system HicA family toxin [Anaerolineae bacterium]
MTKKEKLFEKLLSGSKNFRFDDFALLLEAFGFVLDRVSGSHHVFSHPSISELLVIQPNRNNQVKPYQIRQFLKLIEAYDLRLDGEETS